MGKSFVLKDRAGIPVGYLLQGIQTLRYRVSGDWEEAEAVLFYADGKHSRRKMEASEREMEWTKKDGWIDGAVIVKGDTIIAATDAQAKKKFESMRVKPHAGKREENRSALSSCKSDELPALIGESEGKEQIAEQKNHLPERRWPRPPCWREAVYDRGTWINQK